MILWDIFIVNDIFEGKYAWNSILINKLKRLGNVKGRAGGGAHAATFHTHELKTDKSGILSLFTFLLNMEQVDV